MWRAKSREIAGLGGREFADRLGLSLEDLQELVHRAPTLYRERALPKKSGGLRLLMLPEADLKAAQRRIHDLLSDLLDAPPELFGGIRGRDFRAHAALHQGRRFVLTMDLRSFFDEVGPEMIAAALLELGFRPVVIELITALSTLAGALPQGAPSSPMLANLSLMPLDRVLRRLARRRDLRFSRFLDDLAFSGDVDFRELQGPIVQAIRHRGFEPAEGKTHYMGRNEPQIVTGLIVNDRLRPTRAFYESLDLEIRSLRGTRPAPRRLLALEGRLRHLARFDEPAARSFRRRWQSARAGVRRRPGASPEPAC